MRADSSSIPRRASLRARAASSSASTRRRGMDDLPATARELLRVVDDTQCMLDVVSLFGGTTQYIPMTWPLPGKRGGREGHPLRRVLSQAQMRRVVLRFAGTRLYIPRCARTLQRLRNAKIVERFSTGTARGQSSQDMVQQLARRHRISDRRVWEILKTELV